MYGLLAWTWLRAAAQYPVSMVLLAVGAAVVTGLDLAAIALMFARAPRIAGFTAPEVMFLYGTSGLSFALADVFLGVSPLIQIATEDFSPRRLGKLIPTLAVLIAVIPRLDVSWTPLRALLVPVMIGAGFAIFSALWVLTAAVQFVIIDGHQATKAVTYGGGFLTQYPLGIFGRDFVRGLTFVIPLAFVNWEPSLYVFGRADPLGLPTPVRFASPVVAALLCGIAALAWRSGLRHYRSTGS